MNAQILFAATEAGVFDVLADEGGTLQDVVHKTGLPRESARRLITALCALHLIDRMDDERFANAEEANEKLVRGHPQYVGGMFRHLRSELYPLWAHIDDALFEQTAQWHHVSDGAIPANEEIYEDPEALRDFHQGMFAISYEPAREIGPQVPELETADHIVDVGGSSARF